MIFLQKLVLAILDPLSIILLLLAVSFLTTRIWPRVLAVMILLLVSNPIVARTGIEYLEKDSAFRPISALMPVDKVVVLSGMLQVVRDNEGEPHFELSSAVDRFEAAIKLLDQNIAQKVVFTGGALPGTNDMLEGDILARMAMQRGVDPEKIIVTGRVQNTSQEAIAINELLSAAEKPILITSAFHMPRAQSIFSNMGIKVEAYPVDFNNSFVESSVLDMVPQAGAIAKTSHVFGELLKRAYYWMKFTLIEFAGQIR